ncbi:transcriptional regulator, HxlR family [Pseudomonas benzenivorans]|nr:helix-turn-helix domain-containing protein [Pseudomonas benzenivorans]SDI16320.1 transcriptional regulator, HxlR family [Pseudomonas benzenivorans]
MERITFENRNCSVARSVDVLGDWWNLLIIRELLWGAAKFDEFQRNLEISKGILSKRLKLLQEHNIVVKKNVGIGTEYALTEKGRDVHVIIIAMLQWGDKWNPLPEGAPLIPINRKTGETLAPVQLVDINGEPLGLENLGLRPGPGADDSTHERLDKLRKPLRSVPRQTANHVSECADAHTRERPLRESQKDESQ